MAALSCARDWFDVRTIGTGAEGAEFWVCFGGWGGLLPLLLAAGVAGFGPGFPFPLLAGRRLKGPLAVGAGRFCVGVVVVFFGVEAGGGVAVETARLMPANLAGALERARFNPEDDLMQHPAALPAEAIVAVCVGSEAVSQG